MQRLSRAASRQAGYGLAHRLLYRQRLPAIPRELSLHPFAPPSFTPHAPPPWLFAPTMDFGTRHSGPGPSHPPAPGRDSSNTSERQDGSMASESNTFNASIEGGDHNYDVPKRRHRRPINRDPRDLLGYGSDDEVDPYYSDDMETFNMLDTGEGNSPLPLYKAREMVDFQLSKNLFTGVELLAGYEPEESLKEVVVQEVDDFIKTVQIALALENMGRMENGNKPTEEKCEPDLISKKKLTISEAIQVEKTKDSLHSGTIASEIKEAEASTEGLEIRKEASTTALENKQVETSVKGSGIIGVGKNSIRDDPLKKLRDAPKDAVIFESGKTLKETDKNKEEISVRAETKGEHDIKEEIKKDALDEDCEDLETFMNETVGVIEYGRRLKASYEEERKALQEAESKVKRPTLRWVTRLVLGPGDAWHPANRKVKVSVYVRELCLSKYAKSRLLALVGKRYKVCKDELTIVSERYKHRHENQKDVMRILKDLIEEARNADNLVKEAKLKFDAEYKKGEPLVAGGLS